MKKINPSAKNVLKLGGATLFSQVIGFLILPFLSRIYSPDDFGSLGVFLAISSFLCVIAGFKFENAIVLSKDNNEANNLFWLSFSSTLGLSILTYLFFIITGDKFIVSMGYRIDSFPLYFIPIYVFVFGISQLNKQYFNYTSQFSIISINQVTGRIAAVIPKVVFGMLSWGGIGLIIGEVMNLLSQVIYSFTKFKLDWRKVNLKSLKQVAKKYAKFPIYELPMDFVNTLAQKVPVVLMASYFGVGFVGLYVFCNTIPKQIITLTSQNIGGVYYRKIANQTEEFQKEKTQKLIEKLFLIGVFPFLILTLFAENIYSFIFSDKWVEAGRFVQILSPSFFILFIIKPINNIVFRVKSKLQVSLYFNIAYAILTILVVYFSGLLENKSYAIYGISLISFIVWLVMLCYILHLLRINTINVLKVFLKYLMISFVSVFMPWIIVEFFELNQFLIILSIASSGVLYVLSLLVFDRNNLLNILK